MKFVHCTHNVKMKGKKKKLNKHVNASRVNYDIKKNLTHKQIIKKNSLHMKKNWYKTLLKRGEMSILFFIS